MNLFLRTLFRTALATGAVIGLTLLFAPLLPLYISVASIGVITSVAITKHKINIEETLSSVPAGDLEYYKTPKLNLLEKIENYIAYPFVKLADIIENKYYGIDTKKIEKDAKQFEKDNAELENNESNKVELDKNESKITEKPTHKNNENSSDLER